MEIDNDTQLTNLPLGSVILSGRTVYQKRNAGHKFVYWQTIGDDTLIGYDEISLPVKLLWWPEDE